MSLGTPRLHYRLVDSTNERARQLAAQGAPHGTLVSAREQTAGRGRQGRTWTGPAGSSLLCSVIVRDPPRMLPLVAGVAVAEAVEEMQTGTGAEDRPGARLKWPNDVLLDGRKVAGILVEGRPQEGWAVVGAGVNVAVRPEELPPELRERAGTLGLQADAIEPMLDRLLEHLERWIPAGPESVLDAVRSRDALRGRRVCWNGGEGEATGIDGDGRLLVATAGGEVGLEAGEVHLVGA